MPPIILLFLGGTILTIGDIIFKFYFEKSRYSLYVLGLMTYLVGLIFLVKTFKTQNIAVASAVFIIINIITLLLVSRFYFGEHLSNFQTIGIVIAIIAIFFLELGK
jgi:multidrug transporter EmrE-like cation transporter